MEIFLYQTIQETNSMMKSMKLIIPMMAIFLLSSFSGKNLDEFIGTYSVSNSDPSQIKLTINSDHTFYYQDFSSSHKKIVVNGNWKKKGRKVVLMESNFVNSFHKIWSFAENGQIAKSRNGLTFYRLCKIK